MEYFVWEPGRPLDKETGNKTKNIQVEYDGQIWEFGMIGDPVPEIAEYGWGHVREKANQCHLFMCEASAIKEHAEHGSISPINTQDCSPAYTHNRECLPIAKRASQFLDTTFNFLCVLCIVVNLPDLSIQCLHQHQSQCHTDYRY